MLDDWVQFVALVKGRSLAPGKPLDWMRMVAGILILLYEESDEEAYK